MEINHWAGDKETSQLKEMKLMVRLKYMGESDRIY